MLHDGKEVSPTGFDAVRVFNEKGTDRFAIGVDVNDGYKFKVSLGGALGSNDFVTISTGGNAGFGGWTSPDHAIDANGGIRLLGGARYIRLNNGATELVALDLDGTGPAPTLRLYDSQVVIDSAGNVGIGTTGPAARSEVRASITGSGRRDLLELAHTLQNTLTISAFGWKHPVVPSTIQLGAWNAEQNIAIVTDNEANVDAGGSLLGIFIRSGGNVGFGVTGPATKVHVDGDIRVGLGGQVQFPGSAGLLSSIRAVGTADLTFRVNGVDEGIITDAGYFGMKTVLPTEVVDIDSDAIRLRQPQTPATAGAAGTTGMICWSTGHIYIAVGTNEWERAALSSW